MELKQQAETLLLQLIDKATQAGDFIAEQTPLVIQELLTYNFVMSLLMFITCVLITCVANTAMVKYHLWLYKVEEGHSRNNCYRHDHEAGQILIVFAFLILNPILVAFLYHNMAWLKIWLAPRVYLLEYAASLVK